MQRQIDRKLLSTKVPIVREKDKNMNMCQQTGSRESKTQRETDKAFSEITTEKEASPVERTGMKCFSSKKKKNIRTAESSCAHLI